jgi:hypothetical protein
LILNKPKYPKRGEYKEQNGRTHIQEKKISTKKGKPPWEHQVLEPFLVMKSILNKERGGLFKKTPSLEKASPTATTHVKIKTPFAHIIMPLALYIYKIRAKLREEGF